MAEHTPWKVRGELTTSEFAGFVSVGPMPSVLTCVVRKELAENVVKAVNSHAALKAALERANEVFRRVQTGAAFMSPDSDYVQQTMSNIEDVRAQISRALEEA